MRLRYTTKSKEDLGIAMAWYEKQRRGLGFGFLDCVEVAVKSILDNPKMYRVYYSHFRGCVVRRFPFSIFYTTMSQLQNPLSMPIMVERTLSLAITYCYFSRSSSFMPSSISSIMSQIFSSSLIAKVSHHFGSILLSLGNFQGIDPLIFSKALSYFATEPQVRTVSPLILNFSSGICLIL